MKRIIVLLIMMFNFEIGIPAENLLELHPDRLQCTVGEAIFFMVTLDDPKRVVRIEVAYNEGPFKPVSIPPGQIDPVQLEERQTVLVFSLAYNEQESRFIFGTPGVYRVRVRSEMTSKAIEITVLPGSKAEQQALENLSPSLKIRLALIMTCQANSYVNSPSLMTNCDTIVKEYPNTRWAKYAQGFRGVNNFLGKFKTYWDAPKETIENEVCEDIQAALTLDSNSLFKARILFYLAYARAVEKDYEASFRTIDDILKGYPQTKWAFLAERLRQELLVASGKLP